MKIAENIQKLICLAKEHPELPIIAMVDGEIVGDDCGRWVGDFGSVELGEYVSYNERLFDDREEFKEQFYDYNDDELCKKFGYEPCINEYSLKNGQGDRMKTVTLILPDYYDEAITVTAVGQRKIDKNRTVVNIHTATERVENGQIIDLKETFISKENANDR